MDYIQCKHISIVEYTQVLISIVHNLIPLLLSSGFETKIPHIVNFSAFLRRGIKQLKF